MFDLQIRRILPQSRQEYDELNRLLQEVKIKLDRNLDYILGLYTPEDELVATAGCFENTLRCLAVKPAWQNQGLLAPLVSAIMKQQFTRGYKQLFVYTKAENLAPLENLGFHLLQTAADGIIFMENQAHAFDTYLNKLLQESLEVDNSAVSAGINAGAIVLNANPFTAGHLYLISQAAAEVDLLHLFIVSADHSIFPFNVRKELVRKGTASIKNLVYHDSGYYIVSTATFPAYFQPDSAAAVESQAEIEAGIFCKIAEKLKIGKRFLGTEPLSKTTAIYNRVLAEELQRNGLSCCIIPRKKIGSEIISASTVRRAIKEDNYAVLQEMLPPSTLEFLQSPAASPIINKIKNGD